MSWYRLPETLPALGPQLPWHRRFRNGHAAGRLLDALVQQAERVPEDEAGRQAWRQDVKQRVLAFGRTRLGWPASYERLALGEGLAHVASEFLRKAREAHPSVAPDGLWQALRNVWIGNALQQLMGREVELRPGLFAYSMLYPLTDNRLDDPRIAPEAKRAFSQRFGRRLAGEPVVPADAAEAEVFAAVACVEGEFPRAEFPRVHESLLAIHAAQVQSLRQHEASLDEPEVLAISAAKGGASVLADVHLVTGRPRPEEERFAFRYGFCLQLLDDLQDARADAEAGQCTVFTLALRHGRVLDRPTARLARLLDAVLDEAPVAGEDAEATLDLVRRNCRALLVASVAEQPSDFSCGFRHELEARWPVSLRATRRLRARALRRFASLASRLRARHGAASDVELACSLAAGAARRATAAACKPAART